MTRQRTPKDFWAVLLILTFGFLVPGASAGGPRGGGEAAMAIFGAPGSVLLPGFYSTAFGQTVYLSVNRSLISFSPNLRMIPDLAERWSVTPDGRTYTFTIRRGIRWSDGVPITARDFEYTVLAISSADTTTQSFVWVEEIVGAKDRKARKSDALPGFKVVNDRTFEVTTENPSGIFLTVFGTELMPIPRHRLQAIPFSELQRSEFARVPSVSSGPFFIARMQTDILIELHRNPYYYGRRPALDRVFISILTPEVAIAQLERGELQVIPGEITGELPPTEVARLRGNPDIRVTSYPNYNSETIFLNLTSKPLNDVRIRQAMMYAIDREAIVASILQGLGKVAHSSFAEFTPYYNSSLTPYTFNLERARQLLREANYDPGVRVRFIIPTGDTTRTAVGTAIHQMLQAAGFNVVIEQTDYATAVSRLLRSRDFDLIIAQLGGLNHSDLSRRLHTSAFTGGINAGRYSNPELDRLLEEARRTVSLRDRKPLLDRIQEIVNRDVPVILIYYRDSIGAVNIKQLGGAVPRFQGVYRDMANWYRK